ncbi:alpha/beta hydrolase [Cryobacterium sp. Sr8]|uniref:alpha/beta fold hydrolase n=1 Tax=Cryobacterium sp. Sr8 TaxID=1259203 RepID=UPI001068F33C|nr:alpha/beta hydrolase [Cryobacterium sp. Sr8]TFD76124.1 alpha/beta hydrolase [Cryobacterium sp. Sr8]
MTETVRSADGSTIAYVTRGTGPALILVGGAFSTRQSAGAIASLLAANYRVYAYDRRGRGDSTDIQPYAIEREIEDLAALIEAAGGSAFVYGHSSGAVLALEAAAAGLPITKLAAYEPPYTSAEPGSPTLDGWGHSVQAALDAGDRDRAAVLFMRGTGADPAVVEGMTQLAFWPGMLAIAHTLPYDLALVGSGSVPTERFHRIAAPTLLLHGGNSPAWAGIATSVIAEAIPGARHVTVEGQDHAADPAVLAPVLVEFFGAP